MEDFDDQIENVEMSGTNYPNTNFDRETDHSSGQII